MRAGDFVSQTDERHTKFPVLGALGTEFRRNRIHFLLRLCQRHTRLQSCDGPQPERPAALGRLESVVAEPMRPHHVRGTGTTVAAPR